MNEESFRWILNTASASCNIFSSSQRRPLTSPLFSCRMDMNGELSAELSNFISSASNHTLHSESSQWHGVLIWSSSFRWTLCPWHHQCRFLYLAFSAFLKGNEKTNNEFLKGIRDYTFKVMLYTIPLVYNHVTLFMLVFNMCKLYRNM